MPHCTLEYSQAIEAKIHPSELVAAVYEGALESELFKEPAIKSRAYACEHYQNGAEQMDFIHVEMRILAGRTQEQKDHLSEKVLGNLSSLGLQSTAISLEIVDMLADNYSKVVV